jgi:cytosine deaminase
MSDLVLTRARCAGADELSTISVRGGVIDTVMPWAPGSSETGGAPVLDCGGRAVYPGFVESHLHLDKALLDRREQNTRGDLAGAIAVTSGLKAGFTTDDVLARARQVLDQAITHGTTLVRAHPDVDPIVGLLGFEAVLALREEYRGLVDVQVVAFPQEGIERSPGTYDLLRTCLVEGADVIGGCTYVEQDLAACKRHVATVFDLAEEFGVPVDVHADFQTDGRDPRFALAAHIAQVTVDRGMQGRVTLGHATSLGALSARERDEVLPLLREAGMSVAVLPFTDMHLNGREDTAGVRRGMAPVRALWEAGVTVALSSNNVRNAFTPFGNADLLDVALFTAQTAHLGTPDDLHRLLGAVTSAAAAAVGVGRGYGLSAGDRADLVVLDAPTGPDAMLDRAVRTAVVKGGRVVATSERTTVLHRGAAPAHLPSRSPASVR